MPSSIHHEETAWHARGIAWYRACGAIVFLYHLLVLLCLLCRSPSTHRRWKRNESKTKKKKHTNTHTKSWMAVPVRRDGLGIAVRHAVRLAAKTSREGAQFRRRGAVRPLQPACHEEENAILFHRPRRDHLHTKHRDTTVKWCKSCPSRRALDDGLSSNSSIFFSISPPPSFPFSIVVSNGVSRVQNVEKNYSFRAAHRAEKVLVNISEKFYVSWDIQLLLHVTNDLLLISFIFTVSRKFQEMFKMNSFFFNTLYTYRRYGHRQCRSSPL